MLKIKQKSYLKKIIACMFIAITIFSTAQPIFAVSSSGTGKWVSGQWDSNIFTTDNKTNVGILVRRLVNYTTGERITVFCGEHGINSPTGTIETAEHSVPTDPRVKEACKVAYFGWYSEHGDYVVDGGILDDSWAYDVRLDYVFTQQLIWEKLGQSNATFRDSSIQNKYVAFKTDINNKIANMKRQPSFVNETIIVDVGEEKTITDSNNVLKDYVSFDRTVEGIRIRHEKGQNTLTITVDGSCTKESYIITESTMKSWGIIKEETADHDTTVFFTFKTGVQNQLYALNYNDPVTMLLDLKINLLGNLELRKVDDKGNLLDGAVFTVTGNNYNKDVTVTNGRIVLENLKKGIYTVKEKSAPQGYLLNTNSYRIEVLPNQTVTQTISNEVPTGTFTLIKKNADGTKNLAGTKYRIWNNNGYDKEFTTDKNGKIEVTGLKLGVYNYQETQAIYGYLIDNKTYSFELKYKDQNTKVIYENATRNNEEPTGTFTLVKKNADSSANLEGTVYRVWNDNGYDKQFTTDKNGQIQITQLKLGTYKYQEIQATNGYLLDDKVYTFELNYKDQNTSVVYVNATRTNEEPTGTVTIIKKDSEKGSVPQGDAKLINAKYELYAAEDIYNKARTKKFYSKGDLVETRTTDEKGNTEDITGLPLGKYKVKETVASLGYLLDTKEYEVNLQYKDQKTKIISTTVTSLEVVKKMQVHIFKSGIKEQSGEVQGLEGAEFTIKLNADVERAYEKGYSYAEVWNGIDEYGNKVTVDKNRVAEAQVIAPTYETIVTGKDGNAYTQNKLPFGKYIVKETVTPKDFESAEDFTFSITQDESEVKEIALKVKHLVVNNEQLETYIKLIKKDKKTGKIVTLSSATFEIKATKDIYDRGNGKIIYKKGETIKQKIGSTTYSSFTTNADNIIVPDNSYNTDNDDKGTIVTPLMLEVGSYEITEIRTPDGFLQLETPVQFKVDGIRDYDKDNDGDYIKEVVITNEQPTGTLIIDKTIALREDVDTSLVDTSDLSGIKFRLTAKEDIIDKADGSIIYKKNQEIGTYNLDKNGDLKVANLPMGVYEIQEIETLAGLVLNDTKYEVKFTQKDLVTKVYEENKEIKNDTTVFEFSKTDITGEKELVGAKLTVIDENEKIIDTWVSTETTHKIEGLVVGKSYTLREEIAPDGFAKATDIKFTVKNTADIQKVTMVDKVVEMTKEDIAGNEIEGAELKVVDKDGKIVDSWTSTKEAHKIKGLTEGETYILYEDYAPDGYVISNKVEFTVSADKETQKVTMIDKTVEILKVDIDGNTIEGVTLIVTNTKTKNIVDQWVSTKETHKVSGLIEGETYILHEEKVVDGYVKATDIEFTVTDKKEVQEIKMIDKVVEIIKTDLVTGEELEGAELQVIDEDGNVIDEWVSTKVPHRVKGLEENKKYKLIEKTAPYGFELTEEIEFTVTEDKETQKVNMKDMPILKTVKLLKKDSKTNEVIKDKFTFGIYKDEECTKLIKMVDSNKEQGTITFEDLRYGTYFIKEEKSPKAYVLSDKVVKLEINDQGVFIDGEKMESENSIYTFEFYNIPVDTPKTGDNSNLTLWASLLGLSVISLAVLGVHERKKRKVMNKK